MSKRFLIRTTVWGKSRIGRLALISLFALASLAANPAEHPSPVFIRTTCDGKFSSAALSSLKEEIRTSTKYQLVPSLDDNGRMDEVLTIYMHCTEHSDVVAVATNYGLAKCLSVKECHGDS
jgi:hypothetical protein